VLLSVGLFENVRVDENVTAFGGGEGKLKGGDGTVAVLSYDVFSASLFQPCPCEVPTLTQWGLIVLVVLILFSTWVVLKRRKAVVSRQ
jgi:hypothetical protein